jgi:PDZ domain-containing secreted protein
MSRFKNILTKTKVKLMYLVALLLIVLIPLLFFSLGSGLTEKLGKKIPIKEGTFDSKTGSLKVTKPSR